MILGDLENTAATAPGARAIAIERDPARAQRIERTALALGAVAGVVSLVVGLALGGGVGRALVALGVVLPGLLVQDAWRYVFFAAGRPAAASALACACSWPSRSMAMYSWVPEKDDDRAT